MLAHRGERTRLPPKAGLSPDQARSLGTRPSEGMMGQTGLGTLGKRGRSDTGTRDRHDNGSEELSPRKGAHAALGKEEAVKQPGTQRRARGRPHVQRNSGAESPQVSSWPAKEGDDAQGVTLGSPRPPEGWELPPLSCTHTSLSFPAGFPWGDLCNGFCLLRLPSPGHLEEGVDSRQEVSLCLPALFTSTHAARHSGEGGPGLW